MADWMREKDELRKAVEQSEEPWRVLEERLEFAAVTGMRRRLLPTIEELQERPLLRYVITKHGRPRAVLLSYESYQAMMRGLRDLLIATEREDREVRTERPVRQVPEIRATEAVIGEKPERTGSYFRRRLRERLAERTLADSKVEEKSEAEES